MDSVSGYRMGHFKGGAETEKKSDLDNLRPKRGTGALLLQLRDAALVTVTPCQADPDKWTGWDEPGQQAPTADEATEMCAGCPLLELCKAYGDKARPFGVWGGTIHGQDIM